MKQLYILQTISKAAKVCGEVTKIRNMGFWYELLDIYMLTSYYRDQNEIVDRIKADVSDDTGGCEKCIQGYVTPATSSKEWTPLAPNALEMPQAMFVESSLYHPRVCSFISGPVLITTPNIFNTIASCLKQMCFHCSVKGYAC